MSFNLNKSDGNKSKFDLSKNDNIIRPEQSGNAPTLSDKKKRNNVLLWVIPLLLIIGGIIWYMNRNGSDINDTNSIQVNSNVTGDKKTDESENSADIVSNQETTPVNKTSVNVSPDIPSGATTIDEDTATEISKINNSIPVKFAKSSSDFSVVDNELINRITKLLKSDPNSKIIIKGYASSEGTLDINDQISQKRADEFKKLLVSKGINSANIEAIGKGIDNPVASNETEEGRQKNRRVEVLIQ